LCILILISDYTYLQFKKTGNLKLCVAPEELTRDKRAQKKARGQPHKSTTDSEMRRT
jgi:hypothetical protein